MGGTGEIKRSELSGPTQQNLDKLEDLGFDFADSASVIAVIQGRPSRGKWVPSRTAKSFVISGTDPTGSPVTYMRHETKTVGAGQTYLVTPHGRILVTELLGKRRGARPSSITSKKARKFYEGLVRK